MHDKGDSSCKSVFVIILAIYGGQLALITPTPFLRVRPELCLHSPHFRLPDRQQPISDRAQTHVQLKFGRQPKNPPASFFCERQFYRVVLRSSLRSRVDPRRGLCTAMDVFRIRCGIFSILALIVTCVLLQVKAINQIAPFALTLHCECIVRSHCATIVSFRRPSVRVAHVGGVQNARNRNRPRSTVLLCVI